MAEAEGILAWLVEGRKAVVRQRFAGSDAVNEATKAWQKEFDRLRAYLEEFTVKAEDAQAWLSNKTALPILQSMVRR